MLKSVTASILLSESLFAVASVYFQQNITALKNSLWKQQENYGGKTK